MTSRRLFFKMMREDIRRRLWAVALVILSWFFVFPVRVALIPGEYRLEEALYQQKIVERTEHWFSIGNVWGMFVIILGAVILGISSFSYLHSKKKVDFYHSIPVRREFLFLVNFWDGVWIMAIPYLLSMVCAAAIGASFGVNFSTLIVLTGKAWIFHMIYFLLLYSTTVVAMMMTGNLYLGILGVLVFYFYIPAVGLLAEELHACFFKTYAGQAFWAWKLMDFSPVMAYAKAVGNIDMGRQVAMPIGNMMSMFLISIVLMGIGIFLYQKRPSEAAGKAMAFPISKTPIKILLVIPMTLYGMLFFYNLRESMAWAVFGLVCGCLISHSVIEILYHFDFRKLFAHPVHMAACFVTATLLFLNFSQDWMGYDTYLPKEDEVESSYLDSYCGIDWVEYGVYEKIEEKTKTKIDWNREYEYAKDHMYLTDTQRVLELAQSGIECMKLNDAERRDFAEKFTSCIVTYRLKSGKDVSRRYVIPVEKSPYAEIQDSLEYKKGAYPVLEQKPEEIFEMYVKLGKEVQTEKSRVDADQIAAFLEAYQKDFVTLTVEQQKTENPIGVLYYVPIRNMGSREELLGDILDREIEVADFQYIDKYREEYYQNAYPIYESFENTLALCEATGFDRNDGIGVPYTLFEVRTSLYDGEGNRKFQDQTEDVVLREGLVRSIDREREEAVYSYTNKAEIQELREAAVLTEYTELNGWDYGQKYNVALGSADAVTARRMYQISEKDAPAFLENDLKLP